MRRICRDYVADILAAAQEVEEFTRGMNYETFSKDKKTINAVIRSLEIIGEAAKRIPEEIRQQYDAIPWKRISGMRDKLIHEYSGVDLEIVWAAINKEIPSVRPIIEKMLKDMKEQNR